MKKLKEELQELKKIRRPQVIQRISEARELGDLSENAEYQDAREEQSFIEGRILELENIINKSEVYQKSGDSKNRIVLGSKFLAVCDGEERQFTLVGSTEVDPSLGLISYESPLGRAFYEKSIGDMVEVETPRGKISCKVLKILE